MGIDWEYLLDAEGDDIQYCYDSLCGSDDCIDIANNNIRYDNFCDSDDYFDDEDDEDDVIQRCYDILCEGDDWFDEDLICIDDVTNSTPNFVQHNNLPSE